MKIAKLNGGPEIFYSIQGEGKNAGRPSIFVRTSLCNLQCVWCDTPYTWDWNHYKKEDEILEMAPQEIVKEVRKHPCKNVVLTGGEPLLQQEDLATVMAILRRKDPNYWFEVETNGTILPSERFDYFVNQYNVSPKLQNSGNPLETREVSQAHLFFVQSAKSIFKFVVVEPSDIGEVLEVLKKYKILRDKVYLVPEGTTAETLSKRQLWIAAACKELGFCFSPRLHIEFFGNKRGI